MFYPLHRYWPACEKEHAGIWSPTSQVIGARPEEFYAAFLDPAALIDWLPPAEMTGEIHEFDARVGGGYRMSLFYPPDERAFRGKTSDREDMVNVPFVELAPPKKTTRPARASVWSSLPAASNDRMQGSPDTRAAERANAGNTRRLRKRMRACFPGSLPISRSGAAFRMEQPRISEVERCV